MTSPIEFTVKDSGAREEYDSGMRRDTQEGKPRLDLVIPEDLPYEETMAYRRGMHMMRGATKYGDRNWELADSEEELARFRASAYRHFMQWYLGQVDEDHAAATQFNMDAVEMLRWKLNQPEEGEAEETWQDVIARKFSEGVRSRRIYDDRI